ncbi:MAG TPA: hypothetical protein VKF14_15735 [Candidatus Dormibacteraeota bacterium]|nr:hypothetical protein [Candidatus Dormibacteraeota bacterium]
MAGGFDDGLDADLGWAQESDQGEQGRTEALQRLREVLVQFRGAAPPARAIRAAAVRLRANLGSEEHPFRRLARSDFQPRDDTELLIHAVAATIAPPRESYEVDLTDSGELAVHAEQATGAREAGDGDGDWDAEDDFALDMDTEELELEDWLALVDAVVTQAPGAWVDSAELVRAAGLDPDSDDGWIKQGAFVRALSLWEDFGMLDGGRVTRVGEWVLPRALARAWERDLTRSGDAGPAVERRGSLDLRSLRRRG